MWWAPKQFLEKVPTMIFSGLMGMCHISGGMILFGMFLGQTQIKEEGYDLWGSYIGLYIDSEIHPYIFQVSLKHK